MDDALQNLRDGDIDGALSKLKERVRNDPTSAKERIFLFQLLAVHGDWEGAQTQLNVIAELDDAALLMVQAYREVLKCEVLRSEVFAGKITPLVFGEPEQWVAELIEALKLASRGEEEQSQLLRQKALDGAPATTGEIDGQVFNWIADADVRLGPVFEVVVNGRYYWLPINRVAKMQIEEPCDLRDTVWMPAHFTWTNGGESAALIPTRYPGSENSDDTRIKLSRKTDWLACGENLFLGQGQRLLTTDKDDFPLMDIRELVLHTSKN